MDPKVLWLNVLIYHSQPGGSWTTRRSPPNTGWQQWWYWWQMMIVGKTETCNLETGAGSGCEKNVLWFEVHVRYVLTTHVLQCWCWQTTHTHHNVTDRQTDRQTDIDRCTSPIKRQNNKSHNHYNIYTYHIYYILYPIQYEHAPLRVRCAMLRKHPPVDPVLSILSCFRKPSVGVRQVVSNSPDPGIAWPSTRFRLDLWRWFEEDTASIRRLIHSGYMAKQREATGLDNRG